MTGKGKKVFSAVLVLFYTTPRGAPTKAGLRYNQSFQ